MDSSQKKAQKSQKDPRKGQQGTPQPAVPSLADPVGAHGIKPTELGGGGVPARPEPRSGGHVSSDEKKIAELEAKVASLTEQLKKLTDLAGRAQADLQNAKARLEKDGDDLRRFAAEMFLKKLLPVIDNLDKAMQHFPADLKDHQWAKGIGAIEKDLLRQVTEMGLIKMQPIGQKADPQKHEILLSGPGEEGMVTEVLENGYELHGRVLRPAKVRVGDGK